MFTSANNAKLDTLNIKTYVMIKNCKKIIKIYFKYLKNVKFQFYKIKIIII